MKLSTILASAIVFTNVASVCAQDKTPVPTTPAATKAAAPAPKPASAGLVNDWLRQQSEVFNRWDIGGEFRARYDLKEGAGEGSSSSVDFMKVLPAGKFNDNHYLLLREKIHLGYTPVNWLSAYVSARDANSIGDRRDPDKYADQFDLEQAWIKLGDAKAFPLTLKAGRQELVYGEERMVGRADWNNLGSRAFDGGVLRFETPDVWVDAFAGRTVMADNHNINMPNDYDWLSGLYASTKTLVPFQESQLYFLAHNVSAQAAVLDPGWLNRASTPQDTYTVGMRFKSLPGKLKGWDYSLEFDAQFGSVVVSSQRRQQQGFALMTSGGYTWKDAWGSPRLGLGYDYFSGDSDPNDKHNGTFEPLFPTNHRPLGLMDLVGQKNIHDPRISFTLKPAQPVTVTLEYHCYWLANTADFFYSDSGAARNGNGYGRNATYDSFAGSELNLDATWTIKPWAVLRAGYGHFFVGNYVRDSLASKGGSQDADWLYAQFTLTF